MAEPTSLQDILKRRATSGVKATSASDYGTPTELWAESQLCDPACELCGGIGWLRKEHPVAHPNFGKMFPCDCRQRIFDANRKARLLRVAGIPDAFRGCTFAGFEVRDERLRAPAEAALLMAQGKAPFRWLFLHGSAGWGKSHIAAAVLNGRIEHPEWGSAGVWVEVPELMRKLRAGFKDESYDQTLTAYQEIDLLVLDDLGAEYRRGGDQGMSWASEQLYLILNHRATRKLETIITTNEPVTNLGERIGDRLLNDRRGFVRVFGLELKSYRSGMEW